MKSKPRKRRIPSQKMLNKYFSGEKVTAETAAFGRKVEELYEEILAKHQGSNLKRLLQRAVDSGATREQAVQRAVKAGYLEEYAEDTAGELVGEIEETPMEVTSLRAYAESMYGPRATKVLKEAYFLSAACKAAEKWWQENRP